MPSFHPQLCGGTAPLPQFPVEYLTDNTHWMPNQNTDGLPYGCTSYATVKVARILGFINATVASIEEKTHANALKGFGVLAAIDIARTVLGWFKWRYVLQTTGPLDYFDTFRLAQVSGLPEQRAVSVATPWFASWEQAVFNGQKIMPMPTAEELLQAHTNPNSLNWHNYVCDGWSQNFSDAPGQLLYRLDSWQGTFDYLYLNRATLNSVMDLYGTTAVTITNLEAPLLTTVPLADWFWSLWHSWLGFQY